jgi:type I restriction enzyme R subunit
MKIKTVLDYGGDTRELWNHLEQKDIKLILKELAPLVKPKAGDSDLARFYDKLVYNLITKRLECETEDQFFEEYSIPISKVATISKKLLRKTSIPQVKAKEETIKQPMLESFWKQEGIDHLEKMRQGIRDLMKYLDPEDQKYVLSDFKDQIFAVKQSQPDCADVNVEYVSPFQNNVHRLEQLIRSNSHNVTIERIRKGEQITEQELTALESILFEKDINKGELESEIGHDLNLVKFIISLMGLSEEKVNEAFTDFYNENQLSSVQIQFLETLKAFLTTNGRIDPTKLYDAPFKNYHSLGIEGVFDEQQTNQIFDIIDSFNERNNVG